jgi:hypothetical protein
MTDGGVLQATTVAVVGCAFELPALGCNTKAPVHTHPVSETKTHDPLALTEAAG